jgi:hypothetical protein
VNLYGFMGNVSVLPSHTFAMAHESIAGAGKSVLS